MLAIKGGKPTRTKPFPVAQRFEGNELRYLEEALQQNTLFYAAGNFVKRFTQTFAEMYGMKHCVATSSCTAAIHAAVAGLEIGPGDEVVVSPITDMGGIYGVLAMNATAIFADVDPHTLNVTADNIRKVITERTKAILITHLGGNPCEMDEIVALAKEKGIYLVEDCAQAYGAFYKGRRVGTFGDVSCFSTNEFKHISTGDGGMCLTNDEDVAKKILLFTDKGYNRDAFDLSTMRAVQRLCLNYRMTELQGAVGLAQLEKLDYICSASTALGNQLSKELSGIHGLIPHKVMDHNICSYWLYMLWLDLEEFPCGVHPFAEALNAEGIPAVAGYIGRPVYQYDLFTKNNFYPGKSCPHGCLNYPPQVKYESGLCPAAEKSLDHIIMLKLNYGYGMEDILDIATAIKKVCDNRDQL